MTPTLLYINTIQFGYHIGSYRILQNLKEDFEITYICFDYSYKRIEQPGILVKYVPWEGSYFSKGKRFMKSCLNLIKSKQADIIIAGYFPFVSLFKILSAKQNIILDIRTGSVSRSRINRYIINNLIRLDTQFFKKVTIVSESLADKLKLKSSKVHILPLGADITSTKNKSYNKLHLFYIGTLNGRNVHESIYGLKIFLEQFNGDRREVTYDIFGEGNDEYTKLVRKAILDTGLQEQIVVHGRREHSELEAYFDNCNVGVSYVPITEFYECQPPTKTFEYVNAGMVCIATETKENKKLINSENGVLCRDNPLSFCKALTSIYNNRNKWDSERIRNTLSDYTWDNIAEGLRYFLLEKEETMMINSPDLIVKPKGVDKE